MITTVDTNGNSFTTRTEPSFLSGIIRAQTPQASIIQQFGGLDVTDGGMRILLEFKSDSITNDPAIVNGFLTVHTTFRDSEEFPLCFDQLVVDANAIVDFQSHLEAFELCIDAQPSLESLQASGDYVSESKEFAFVGKGDRQDGVIIYEIFEETYNDLLRIASPILENGEYFLIVELSQVTFTANDISYYLNFIEIPLRTDLDFITLRDPFLIQGFDVKQPLSAFIPKLETEIILTKHSVDDNIPTPIPERPDLKIVPNDFTDEEPTIIERITKPITDFFQSIASFFQGLFGGGENGGEVPESVAICIDGIYFGVCTGDEHFDSDQACFGLTTQQCFDECNVIGTTCRIE